MRRGPIDRPPPERPQVSAFCPGTVMGVFLSVPFFGIIAAIIHWWRP